MAQKYRDASASRDARASSWLDAPESASHISQLMNSFHVPGLAIAIVDDSNIHSKAFGYACINSQKPCTADTLFDIASCSKALTAITVALLVENNDFPGVAWNSVVSDLLPDDFVLSSPEATADVTIEDILSHRSGLPSHDLSILGVHSECCDNARSITKNLRNLYLKAPKSTYQYSNIMYTAATHLIETLSEKTFSTFLHEELLQKMEMNSTFLQPSEVYGSEQQSLLSTPYYFRDGAYHRTCHQETPEGQGAGSIQTSVNDLAKFIRAMINQSCPITHSLYESITTPRITKDQRSNSTKSGNNHPPPSYALGWDVKYYRETNIISHDGVITGYGSRMFILPDYKVGAVILGNSDGAFDLSFIIQSYLVDEILDVSKEERFDVAAQRLKRFTAQEARREKTLKRNAARRDQAKDTLKFPLETYPGTYHNAGYRNVTVQKKDGSLFIDGRDRSMPFTMLLEHVSDNAVFKGYLADDTGEDVVPVQFRFGPEGKTSAIGMVLEPALGDDYYIWFDRIHDT